jgi:hypothetical protein
MKNASREFLPRRYVVAPTKTPYPPGLAHNATPVAAASHESCIIHSGSESCHSPSDQVALTPERSTSEQWQREYKRYHKRQATKQLRAAFCQFELVDGREALATEFDNAPRLSRADWEGYQLNMNGRIVGEETGKALARKIAEGKRLV